MPNTIRRQLKGLRCLFAVTICSMALMFALIPGKCFAGPPARIILLETFDVPVILEHTMFFLDVMEKLGYRKENIVVLKANGDAKRAERQLRESIVQKRPNVMVANATLAAQVAYPISKSEHIPMVFFVVSDPVGAGIVSKLNVPSRELVSGVVHSVPRDTKVEMVMRVLGPLKPKNRPIRFGYIHSSYPSAVGDLRMLREAARKRGDLEFLSYQIPYDEKNFNIQQSIGKLIEGVKQLDPKIDYWWISQDPVAELKEFVEAISKHSNHPIACGTNMVDAKTGSLLYIAANTEEGSKETAEMVDAILKGTDVSTIPVHSPAKIDFGVNLSTALRMGIAIPSDMIQLAGPNVFK